MKVLSMGGLAVRHDLQAGQYFVLCPQCRERALMTRSTAFITNSYQVIESVARDAGPGSPS